MAERIDLRALLEQDVWVLGTQESDTGLMLHTWEGIEGVCGAFTSRALLEEVMDPCTTWIQVNARVIFGAMLAAGLGTYINPRHESQLRLRPYEISALLAAGINA